MERNAVKSAGAAVEVEGLRKTYGKLVAVDGLSFTAQRGDALAELSVEPPTLEDRFMEIVGRKS